MALRRTPLPTGPPACFGLSQEHRVAKRVGCDCGEGQVGPRAEAPRQRSPGGHPGRRRAASDVASSHRGARARFYSFLSCVSCRAGRDFELAARMAASAAGAPTKSNLTTRN